MIGGDSLWGETTNTDEAHYAVLERLAATALNDKSYVTAFQLADRRCRIHPPPMSHSYLLRAEASFGLGHKQYAIEDLSEALAISPMDLHANRRMLAWSRGPKRRTAALTLISCEHNFEILRQALALLCTDDRIAYASINAFDQTIEGWAVWDHGENADLTVVSQESSASYSLEPDLSHPLSNERLRAANILVARPRSSAPQSVSVAIANRRFFSLRIPGNDTDGKPSPKAEAPDTDGLRATVIVPIYDDFAATKKCLDSLVEAVAYSPKSRAVLVNDATPDPRIERLLSDLVGKNRIEVLSNQQNLGFVGSVNRALARTRHEDVILLNSDTIVPIDFIDRLALTAHNEPKIGTVTPLSNNGEFTSFPIPLQSNPLATLKEIKQLDHIASEANRGVTVDIPSGIGFCLYITRSCLDAVGQLSESYHRGYLEDVDFCLRARERGFRNICAPSVYVGHAGSRSFKTEKRALVVRNLDVLDVKFPSYRRECAAFEALDPLRPARERIERRWPLPSTNPRLIVCGTGAPSAAARGRAKFLHAQSESAIILEISNSVRGLMIRPRDISNGYPQNLEFAVTDTVELNAFAGLLKKLEPSGVEIWEPAAIPNSVLKIIVDADIPYDLVVADAGIQFPKHWRIGDIISDLEDSASSANARPSRSSTNADLNAWRKRWRDIASSAKHIVAASPMASAFAEVYLGNAPVALPQESKRLRRPTRQAQQHTRRLGVLSLARTADALTSLQYIVRALNRSKPDLTIVIVGATVDDRLLMRTANCFVTGPVKPTDIRRLVVQYNLDCLFAGVGPPLFGHPLEQAAESEVPMARFDWSFGRFQGQNSEGDLMLLPDRDYVRIAEQLVRWIEYL